MSALDRITDSGQTSRQGFVFLVARSPEINYLLICLARSPVEKRQRIWADRIPQLPTVAFEIVMRGADKEDKAAA
jgi:hypothetical protein